MSIVIGKRSKLGCKSALLLTNPERGPTYDIVKAETLTNLCK